MFDEIFKVVSFKHFTIVQISSGDEITHLLSDFRLVFGYCLQVVFCDLFFFLHDFLHVLVEVDLQLVHNGVLRVDFFIHFISCHIPEVLFLFGVNISILVFIEHHFSS